MMQLAQFALAMLQKNPNVGNKPLGKELMNILQTGNYSRGIEIANNLCQTYNTPKEQVIEKAREYFHM